MSWGVATQNGVSVSLASIVSLSCGATEFSPYDLFTGGVQGAWYDPSDYSTLFQDSTGTTPVTAVEQPVGRMLDKSGNNNHALQATAASRPVLRARYNLLTYSEQFDNAAWTKSNAAVTANATTAPDGALTADLLTPDATAAAFHLTSQSNALLGATVISVYAKPNGYDKLAISVQFASVVVFDVTAGTVVSGGAAASIQSVGNGWYRCSYSFTRTGTSNIEIGVARQSDGAWVGWAPNGTSGIYIWGAQSNLGTSIGTYQQIAAATSYNTVGFLPYLSLDGVDDSYSTSSINFAATDKMSGCIGLTKLSGAAEGIVAEHGVAGVNANADTILSAPGNGGDGFYPFASSLRPYGGVWVAGASPITVVASVAQNAAAGGSGATNVTIRLNGALPTQTPYFSSTSTAALGNYPLYIGRRNNATLPLNGRLYQMVICGKALSASELASTEAYVNTKTGAY